MTGSDNGDVLPFCKQTDVKRGNILAIVDYLGNISSILDVSL